MIVLEIDGRDVVEVRHGLRIGRDRGRANLVLDHDFISRHHLELIPEDDAYRVWDLGSQNGTAVNGRQVAAAGQLVAEGDVIRLGGQLEIRVVSTRARPSDAPTTVIGPQSIQLRVELHPDQFIVDYKVGERVLRDAMPYQLGLALSLLALYQRDRLGPVPDADMRALVWRGDKERQRTGDLNRMFLRLRTWFRKRELEPPSILRPKRAGSSRLLLPAACITVQPDGWLYQFLDGD